MKKVFLALMCLLILSSSHIVVAQEKETDDPTPSGNEIPEDDAEIEQIQRIKDIVASKVAELNLVEKKGIIGRVTEVSNTEVTIIDRQGEEQEIDVDELTKFNFDDEDFGILDLTTDNEYSFIGLHNKDTDRLLARFIDEPASIPVYREGAISAINEDDFQIVVVDVNGAETTVDIENSTNTMSVDDDGELTESGFSGLVLGEKVIVVGFTTEEDTLSADRLIHFTDIPPSAALQAKLQGTSETTVATGSGNTLEIIESEVQ